MKPNVIIMAATLLLSASPWQAAAATLLEAVSAHDSGDFESAHELLLPLAEHGSVEAQFRLATLYSLGQGRPTDQAAAAYWYEKAAAQDHHKAAVTLANMYLSGLGVARDENAAIRWFERAAVIAERLALEEEECD